MNMNLNFWCAYQKVCEESERSGKRSGEWAESDAHNFTIRSAATQLIVCSVNRFQSLLLQPYGHH